MIPKRIVYTWFGNKSLTQESLKYIKTWRLHNPEYEIVEINENNFDVNQYQFTKKAYQAGEFAFVSDMARIWAINQLGGIYLDTDVEVLKSFDSLLDYDQFWAKEDAGQVASGLAFGSKAHEPLLEEILQSYAKLDFKNKDLTSISTVMMISTVLREHGLKNDRRTNYLDNQGIIFPPSYFAPLHYWGGGRVRDNTYSIHHYNPNPSWTNQKRSGIRYLTHEIMYYFPTLGASIRWMRRKSK